jgi:hypothetical protein
MIGFVKRRHISVPGFVTVLTAGYFWLCLNQRLLEAPFKDSHSDERIPFASMSF